VGLSCIFNVMRDPFPQYVQSLLRRRAGWLLLLSLLLPIAQAAGSWHVLSHAPSTLEGEGSGKKAVHQAGCGVCLAAATLVAGAPPVAELSWQVPTVVAAASRIVSSGIEPARRARAYDSRAPPLTLH